MAFEEFPKIARFSRGCTVTEKIDGTNAQVHIIARVECPDGFPPEVIAANDTHVMLAGSRNRYITPGADNFGFASWVKANAEALWGLGDGRHFGEWWGSGIQRGYGLTNGEKRFSLFNTRRWAETPPPACCSVVPVLYEGAFSDGAVNDAIAALRASGSAVSPGFMQPEGVVVFHHASRTLFKKTVEKDEEPKGRKP